MQKILDTSEKSSQVVEELNEASTEIGEIIEVISDIADQTNLLALNAAIEAARASSTGGQKHGFTVVAEEIRALAEKIKKSIVNVQKIIDKLFTKTDQAVNMINKNNQQVKVGAESLDEAGDYFQSITGNIDEVSRQIQQIASFGQAIAVGSKEISDSTEEQSTSMEQITFSLDELNNMAEDLNKLVNQFKL